MPVIPARAHDDRDYELAAPRRSKYHRENNLAAPKRLLLHTWSGRRQFRQAGPDAPEEGLEPFGDMSFALTAELYLRT